MSRVTSRMTAWYVSRKGSGAGGNTEPSGPFATDMVLAMLRDGQLQPVDLVYQEGASEWKPAASFTELRPAKRPGDDQWDQAGALAEPAAEDRIRPAPLVTWILLRPHGSTYLQEGPYSTHAVVEGLKTGRFLYSQYAWRAGQAKWARVGDLPEFDRRGDGRDILPPMPPPLPDPIEAILLEDDDDTGAEEFHVAVPTFNDDTPAEPMTNTFSGIYPAEVKSISGPEIGGAAALNPEDKKSPKTEDTPTELLMVPQALALTDDLANVPWETTPPLPKIAPPAAPPPAPPAVDDVEAKSEFEVVEDLGDGDEEDDVFEQFGEKTALTHVTEAAANQPFVPPTAAAPMPKRWKRLAVACASAVALLVGGFYGFQALIQQHLGEQTPLEMANLTGKSNANPREPATSDAMAENTQLPSDGVAQDVATSVPMSEMETAAPAAPPAIDVHSLKGVKIVGQGLTKADARIVLQGAVPTGRPIRISFRGRLGQVLGYMSVRKSVTLERKGSESPSVALKSLMLPQGAYTVEVEIDDQSMKEEIFVGTRDKGFLSRLEAHLRNIAFESQSQKKALFYAASEMDQLARELGQQYGVLRQKPDGWTKFYSKWTARLHEVHRTVSEISAKSIETQGYPEETSNLMTALGNLMDSAAQFDLGIGQKRDVASDALSDLIAELTRQKAAIGAATARSGGEQQ